eukprot:11226079-Lingulodinium_polyedra.AAC.1
MARGAFTGQGFAPPSEAVAFALRTQMCAPRPACGARGRVGGRARGQKDCSSSARAQFARDQTARVFGALPPQPGPV